MSWIRLGRVEAILIAGGLGAGLVVASIAFELYGRLVPRYRDIPADFDPELGWVLTPNSNKSLTWGRVTTNSLGFRSPELDGGRDSVILLGDSVAFGVGVSDDQTLAAHLERDLSRLGVQVANLAVPGYGLDQYDLSLRRHIGRFARPRAIVLVICAGNDIKDTGGDFLNRAPKPRYRLRDGRLAWTGPWSRYGLPRFFLRLIGSGGKPLDRGEALAVSGLVFDRIVAAAASRRVPLLVVVSPLRLDFTSPSDDLAWFRALCRKRAGYDCVDYYQTLWSHPDMLPLAWNNDGVHYSEAGNRALGEAIAERLAPGLIKKPWKKSTERRASAPAQRQAEP